MAHVTFIHGIANKPPREKLLENWVAEIAAGGLDLDTQHVTTSMVYWADVMYEKPQHGTSDFESVDSDLGTAPEDEELAWLDDLSAAERAFSNSLIKKLGIDTLPPSGNRDALPENPLSEDDDFNFEAIPLPWFIKERVMKRLLKDVHHYLFNASFSPRKGETYEVQTHLRELFVNQLREDQSNASDGPHVVVAHSMGTVISYDCLKNVENCPPVDALITVGSPLGLSEIHDNYKPRYNRSNAFPSENVRGDWVNIFDRLDPVAFDARLANDYLLSGSERVIDNRVRNSGVWRHSSSKYFRQTDFRSHLASLLRIH